jgi:hypothetical protein
MQPRLVGEGAGADIGRAAQGHPVQDVVQHAADLQNPLQGRLGNPGFETAG